MVTKNRVKHGARPDEDIARDVRRSMKLDSEVPDERISVTVHRGSVTIEGTLDRSLQKEAAEADARKVKGVRAVTNRIAL